MAAGWSMREVQALRFSGASPPRRIRLMANADGCGYI